LSYEVLLGGSRRESILKPLVGTNLHAPTPLPPTSHPGLVRRLLNDVSKKAILARGKGFTRESLSGKVIGIRLQFVMRGYFRLPLGVYPMRVGVLGIETLKRKASV